MRFLLLDRLLELEPGKRAVGHAVFAPDLTLFEDHFPDRPLVPGTLLTETMAQTAGWLLAATLQFRRWPLLTLIDRAKFYKGVGPGEEIVVEAVIQSAHQTAFETRTAARVSGRRVASARLLFHVEEASHGSIASPRFESWARRSFVELGGDALLVTPP